jgi:DNA replication protein DnaC
MKIFEEKIILRGAAMLNNATLSQLREMGLSAMASCFRQQSELCSANQNGIGLLSFDERFGLLVETEWLSRRNNRINRLIKQAGFRFPALLEDIDYTGKHGITKPEILRLSLGNYIKKAQNVFISGPTGVGKTYIACALGRAACTQGVKVLYTRVSDFFQNISNPVPYFRQTSFRDKCAQVPLLIFDDWGLKKFSPEETHELSNLFERRYGQVSTIISGQVPSASWHELFPDPTQADSILDRIVHNAYPYNITGDSMRKTIGKKSLEDSDS